MKTIAIFDHDTENNDDGSIMEYGGLIKRIKDACRNNEIYEHISWVEHGDDEKSIIELSKHRIVIAHIDADYFCTLVEKQNKDVVRMFVSTVGHKGKKSYKDTQSEAYCLYLQPPHMSEKINWLLLLEAIQNKDTVEKIIREDVPPELLSYFNESKTGNIVALGILCQGFLVAYACSKRRKGEHISSEFEKRALEKIGFKEFIADGENNLLIQKISDCYNEGLGGVLNRKWWTVFEGGVRESISSELKSIGVPVEGKTHITELISRIDESCDIQDPELVANAYLEMIEQTKRLP
jgi:hypothetical protein